MTLKKDLVSYLQQTTDITNFVAQRIYLGKAPQGNTYPWLRITIASEETATQLSGPTNQTRPRVQIDAIAHSAGVAADLADAVRTAMWNFVGDQDNIVVRDVTHDNTTDFEEPEGNGKDSAAFMVRQDFLVWHSQTIP